MTRYPEHEKQSKFLDAAQAIGEFLDESGYTLAEWHVSEDSLSADPSYLMPVRKSTQRILAEYFGIDENKIEAEKRQMIEEMRG